MRVEDILAYKQLKKAKALAPGFRLPGREEALEYLTGREQIRHPQPKLHL